MKIDEICQLAKWLREGNLSVLELNRMGETLLLRRAVTHSVPISRPVVEHPTAGELQSSVHRVIASGPGVFFATAPGEKVPFVKPGDAVQAGQLIGVLRVDTLYLPIRAEIAGRVLQALERDGERVGYGQPLFELGEAVS